MGYRPGSAREIDDGGAVPAARGLLAGPPGPESSEDWLRRIMSRFVGGGYAAYLIISIPQLGPATTMVANWYTPVAVIAAFGPGIALIFESFRPTMSRLSPVVCCAAVGYLVACALWFVAWDGAAVPDGEIIWLRYFAGLPALAVLLVWPIWLAGGTLVVTATSVATVVTVGDSGRQLEDGIAMACWSIAFTGVFLLAAAMALRTGRALDEARVDAFRAAADAAGMAARSAERARFDSLIHDRVIATLLAVTAGDYDRRLPDQARSAVAELEALAHPVAEVEVGADEVSARLRSIVGGIDDDAQVGVAIDTGTMDTGTIDTGTIDTGTSVRYPTGAVRAVSEAVAEAVRNSVLHAGPEASRGVLVSITADSITALVVDDGVGFEPAAVPPERLGIEVSIRRRLAMISGGDSIIDSVIGQGTTVRISWRRGVR